MLCFQMREPPFARPMPLADAENVKCRIANVEHPSVTIRHSTFGMASPRVTPTMHSIASTKKNGATKKIMLKLRPVASMTMPFKIGPVTAASCEAR